MQRTRRPRGFTLIEILIALVIVSIGLIGILALLTSSLKAAGEIVEDSVAATTARSVYESLREGTRKRGFIIRDGANYVRGFVFLHEGIKDTGNEFNPPTVPNKLDDTAQLGTLRKSDFVVFLPAPPPGTPTGGGSSEPVFVYPRPTTAEAENTANTNNVNTNASLTNIHGVPVPLNIKRTYQLRDYPGASTNPDDLPRDIVTQYSFAFAIQRAISPKLMEGSDPIAWGTGPTLDPAQFPPRNEQLHDGLYMVEVMVFRNFDPTESSRTHEPVNGGRFVGLLAIGP